jgi:AraC-like DNA-binding protein
LEQFYYACNKPDKNMNLKQYVYKISSYHYNWHKDLELLLVLNGEVEVCANGVIRILETNDMIIINSNIGHATLAKSPDSTVLLLHIDPIFFEDYYENIEFLSFDCCSVKEIRNERTFILIRAFLSQMILSFNKKDPEQQLLFECSFYSLIHTVILHFPPKVIQATTFIKNQKKLGAIDKMIKYINRNYSKKITLEKLAKETSYNPNYVSQLFKSHLDINFYEYLTRIRLREATLELGRSENKISEIALSNGFSDIKAFTSAFRESFGKSPTEYRKQLNNEHVKTDIKMKRQFVSSENEAVNKKLIQYIADKNSYYSDDIKNNYLENHENMIKSTKLSTEMLSKLNVLAHEFEKTTTYLAKVIASLSE